MTAKVLIFAASMVLLGWHAPFLVSQEPAEKSPASAVQSAGPAGLETKKVKMPDGSVREMKLPPGAKLPAGAEIVEEKGKEKEGDKTAKDDKAAGEPTKAVTRGNEPPEKPDPDEFKVVPDSSGLIAFQFRNQSWPDLLKWLAKISNMSLDWQELPGDYVNLATQRKYGVEETRDLFNGHLLARGYTLLEKDGMLQVVKTDQINLALVPIVDANDLQALPGNRFVRTSFKLDTLIVDQIVEELQPLKSRNGQLIGLTATNRLEAVDSVSNLLAIKRILDDEQSEEAINQLAREFNLEHIRAEDAKQQLEVFLGIKKDSAGAASAMNSQQMQQIQQQMQQQMQQMQQQAAKGGASKAPPGEEKVYLVANTRMNSIIAHAPPDKLAVIAAFVRRIDVPGDSAMSLDMLQNRMKTYRLASLDPERLATSLHNMDALEPKTRIEVDSKNKAILVFASLADHLLIEQVVERLDGSAREFDVIQLRRLFAEDVAGTIKMMMGGEEEEPQQQNRYSYYSYFNPRGSEEESSKDKFRVTANVNDNQILIWANPQERQEINKLLIKLGELPPEGGSRSPFRTIDAAPLPETYEYLERIRKQWALMSDIPLELPSKEAFDTQAAETTEATDSSESEAAADEQSPASQEQENPPRPTVPANENITAVIPPGKLSQVRVKSPFSPESANTATTEASTSDTLPPIRIAIDPQGNLVLYSENLEALNALETLMSDVAPPSRPYHVVKVKHQTATWITYDLEDYFKDLQADSDKDQDPRAAYYSYIFGIETGESKKKTPAQLGRKRPLRFIPNNDTQTILVIGADADTFATVQRLVELWDVPDKVDDSRVRYTEIVPIQYSRADLLVETMKEAFRDLLSSNDKAFQKKNSDDKGGSGEGAAVNSSSVTSEGGMDFSFSGKLSFGVDKVTNSILVSSEKQLLQLIVTTIKNLDEAAKPSADIEVHKIDLAGQESFRKALQAILGQEGKKQPPANGQPDGRNPNADPQQQLNAEAGANKIQNRRNAAE